VAHLTSLLRPRRKIRPPRNQSTSLGEELAPLIRALGLGLEFAGEARVEFLGDFQILGPRPEVGAARAVGACKRRGKLSLRLGLCRKIRP
jgi:hypothetical protein